MIESCRRHKLLCLGVSAVLSALPLTFPALFLLSWFSWIPFFFVFLSEEKPRLGRCLGRGMFFGFLYHFCVYYWFLWLYPFDFMGFTPGEGLFVVLLAWLGASFLHGVLFLLPALAAYLLPKLVKSAPVRGFGIALSVLAAEKIMELSPLAFPWVRVSLGQYRAPILIRFAGVAGTLGLDLLILAVNLLFLFALLSKEKKRLASLLLAGGIFVTDLLFGVLSAAFRQEGKTLKVALVQGSILSGEKWENGGLEGSWEIHSDLTRKAAERDPDLIVWAETAVNVNLQTYSSWLSRLQALSAEVDTPLLIGAFSGEEGKTRNSAYLITASSVSEPYSKRHLAPFGETMPYRDLLSRLFPSLMQVNNMEDLDPGVDPALFGWQGEKIGCMVCFDSVFSALARESARDGAGVFVIVTNDSWYEDSPAAAQHLAHAVFRSVENGRATARCANSGISALISADGSVTEELGTLERGAVLGEVSFSSAGTLYSAAGDSLLLIPAGLWLAACVFFALRERKKNG